MTDPQTLHDLWLILTVVTTLECFAIAIYLWRTFRDSSRRWFFWWFALMFAAIALEQSISEVKNIYHAPPPTLDVAQLWVFGRAQEMIVLGLGLGYLVFGRNGSAQKET